MLRNLLLLVLFLLANSSVLAQPEYIPNDPNKDLDHARAINLLRAYAKILEIEQTTGPKLQQGIVVFMDEWVDCTHAEFVGTCLPQYAYNATDRAWQNSNLHGMHAAGIGGAGTDNHAGVSSPNFMNRLKFIPFKVCEGNNCQPEWAEAGLRRALELKRSGLPILVIGVNVITGVTDPVAMDQLLRDLDSEGIDIIAPDGDAGPTFNYDLGAAFPLTYARTYPNIIAVTAGDQTAERLSPGSSLGPKTFSLTAPGINVRTISLLNPTGGSASMSGSSSVTQQISSILALIRIYREPDSTKARFVLKFTARMFPELEGRLNAGPGATDDAGRMAGRVDVYDALSMTVGCPPLSSAVMWVSKRDSNRAIALDSVLLTAGPFAADNPGNYLAPDRKTRIMLFAYNVPAGSIGITARDSAGHAVQLPVEYLGPLPQPLSCVSQINVKLTPNSPQPPLAVGDVSLTLTVNGQTSSVSSITIK